MWVLWPSWIRIQIPHQAAKINIRIRIYNIEKKPFLPRHPWYTSNLGQSRNSERINMGKIAKCYPFLSIEACLKQVLYPQQVTKLEGWWPWSASCPAYLEGRGGHKGVQHRPTQYFYLCTDRNQGGIDCTYEWFGSGSTKAKIVLQKRRRKKFNVGRATVLLEVEVLLRPGV